MHNQVGTCAEILPKKPLSMLTLILVRKLKIGSFEKLLKIISVPYQT